jgi:hypothetical protein
VVAVSAGVVAEAFLSISGSVVAGAGAAVASDSARSPA